MSLSEPLAPPTAAPAQPVADPPADPVGEGRHALVKSSTLPHPDEPRERLRMLLTTAIDLHGSDLHLSAGTGPKVRVHGDLKPISGWEEPLQPEDVAAMARTMLSHEDWEQFTRTHELDLAYAVEGVGRFRVNLYQQRGTPGAAFRAIPSVVRDLDSLGLPAAVASFAQLKRGLVLVTGPTGSGKSTTLASLLDLVNQTRAGHVMTIEDPIEFVHTHGRCVVHQREVGRDTAGFATALRQALRQDPDVILVGELRDLETTAVAVSAAETGHLVLATLHTRSAATTVDRLIDIFPAGQQQQIRTQLAGCLAGVVSQSLAPTRDGKGRTVIAEVMVATPAIRNLIREAKVHQIPTAMQASGGEGMVTFDQDLARRFQAGEIARHTALELAHQPDEFDRMTRW